MLIFIVTCQTMAQGAAEASSNRISRTETAPEQLATESCISYRWPEDWSASATTCWECISKRGLFYFLFLMLSELKTNTLFNTTILLCFSSKELKFH